MASQTRRAFLQHAPLGAAAISVMPALPAAAATQPLPAAAVSPSTAASAGSMVIHVNDVAAGRMTLFIGEREVALRSPRLVAYFIEAARSGR
jgi:hypothetical protein